MESKTRIHLPLIGDGRKVKIPTTSPIIFLAGPIRNAPKWQESAVRQILASNIDIFVASPTRYLSSDLMDSVEKDDDGYTLFERQRAWEQYYLKAAAIHGVIVFWLPKEASPKEVEDKVYAHITMMELGEWIIRKRDDPNMQLIVGTDGEFPEWSTIKYEIETETTAPIFYTLEETINEAIKLSQNQYKR